MEVKQYDDELPVRVPLLLYSYDTKEKEVCDIVEIKDTVVDIKPTTALNFTGTTSYLNTTFNGLNALSGAGVLSIPYALSSGGWLSLILLFIIASATFYTGLLIKRCIEIDPNIRSYPDVGNKAFGKKGATLVSVFLSLELYMVATGFLILAGDNLHNLFPDMKIDIDGVVNIGGKPSFVVILALIMTPTVWINDMTTLSYVSATGVLASLVILGSVLWSGLSDDIGFPYTLQFNEKSNTILVLTYASMAILGYLMFGSEVQSQITLNLPTHKFSSKVAIYTALINPIAKYALTLRPIVDAIEDCVQLRRCYSLILRTTLVCSSVIVALTVPFFGYLMSLVGAFLSVTTSILLPCFCYLKISGAYRKIGLELAISSSIVLMGLIILVIEHIRLYIILVSKKSMDDVG
ncbi:UNVERIFIED_CONTAM: Amino acid transporter AVT1J [Sesamum radiatum]|uniref:Amino acid transporter AVT1J n=1 Tax=Sesamum radiatum TaxID=300843 RepID=A0AAW2P4A8_SESRA